MLAKTGRGQSMTSTRMARLAAPHDDMSMSFSELSDESGNTDELSGNERQVRNGVKTAATLCIAAAICCGVTAIGAILLLRGPREVQMSFLEKENSEKLHMSVMDSHSLTEVNTSQGEARSQTMVDDEREEVKPEEAM